MRGTGRLGTSWMKFGLAAGVLALAGCTGQVPIASLEDNGDYAMSVHRYEDASAAYAEYVDRKQDDQRVRYKLARSLIKQGKYREAREQFRMLLDADRADAARTTAYSEGLAQALFENREFDSLAVHLDRMCEQRGLTSDFMLKAKYSMLIGHPDEAEQALIAAGRTPGGRTTEVYLAQAEFYRGIGKPEQERTALRRALFLDPGRAEISQRLRELGEIPGPTAGLAPDE